ncbi:MAG: hypothetical protein K0S22_1128 [Oscillospiraceae bacterium]|jgi:uncharacterized membrane protein|nr:hypothetical protein [Oscillospiraceae bacterium]
MDDQNQNTDDIQEQNNDNEISYISLGMCIGVGAGSAIGGIIFDNMLMGITIGIALGIIAGAIIDSHKK